MSTRIVHQNSCNWLIYPVVVYEHFHSMCSVCEHTHVVESVLCWKAIDLNTSVTCT